MITEQTAAEVLFAAADITITADLTVRKVGHPIGLLNPGVLLEYDGDRKLIGVLGPDRYVKVTSMEWAVESLVAAGLVLLGTEQEIQEVKSGLSSMRWSRTLSFLFCRATSLAEILSTKRRLSELTIGIIGCGGIGSLVAVLLAGLNVKSLFLFDHDIIEESNLNRQLFWTLSDIGKGKVETLASVLASRSPNVKVENYPRKMTANGFDLLRKGCDAVLLTADEPLDLAKSLQKFALENPQIVCIGAGYALAKPSVTIYGSGLRMSEDIYWRPVLGAIMPSYGPLNAEIAGRAVDLLVKNLGAKPAFYAEETW